MIHTFAPALKAKSWLKGKIEIGFRLCEDKVEEEEKGRKKYLVFFGNNESWVNFVVPKVKSSVKRMEQ